MPILKNSAPTAPNSWDWRFETHEITDLEARLAAEVNLRGNECKIKELEFKLSRKDKPLQKQPSC